MYQKCVFCPLLPRTVQTVSHWAGLFAGGWHLSVSFLGAPRFSQLSERGGRESHVCLICIPSPARQTLCWVLSKYNGVGWEIFFMNIFSHNIWEKYSFKAGICPPVPRWLMCAQACTNRHHCSALQDHDFFFEIQITTFMLYNNDAWFIAGTEAHGCHWKAALLCPVCFPIIIPRKNNSAYARRTNGSKPCKSHSDL